jgi:hypothetical protein
MKLTFLRRIATIDPRNIGRVLRTPDHASEITVSQVSSQVLEF